jgi:hypothetical protein
MNDRIRISDADRERVAAKLREHYAEGRLTSDELDERLSAALSAKTVGELRRVMADLPDDAGAPMPPQDWPSAPRAVYYGPVFRRGPRILPILLIGLILMVAFHGAGWLFFGLLNVILLAWLAACVVGLIAMARFRRHARRFWQSGGGDRWRDYRDQWRQYQGWRG